MTPRRIARVLPALALAWATTARAASDPSIAVSPLDPTRAEAQIVHELREHPPGFCSKSIGSKAVGRVTMDPRDAALCPYASALPNCPGFADACEASPPTPRELPDLGWLKRLLAWLGDLALVARYVVWALVIVVALALVALVVRAIVRLRRDRALAEEGEAISIRAATESLAPLPTGEPEALLQRADGARAQGDFRGAIALYLDAALIALERAGALERAKHRTHGEYVRMCTRADARRPLGEITHEVDAIKFGDRPPTDDRAGHVGALAHALVARLAMPAVALLALVLSLTLSGCPAMLGGGERPHGSELFWR